MGLPSNYKRLQYIESTGTQYIDTGFKPNQDTRVNMSAQYVSNNASVAANEFFGARTSTSSKVYALQYNATKSVLQQFYNDGYTELTTAAITERQKFDFNKNVLTTKDITNTRTYAAFQCDYTLYLFALNNAGTVSFQSCIRVYSCKIYDNGTLVRNFVPCMSDTGVVGMYDYVNNVFYGNAGTGTFVAGPELTLDVLFTDIADAIREKNGKAWPEGYTALEYIQSTGTQYIDTGFCHKYNSRVVMEVSDFTSTGFYFGAKDANTATASSQFGVFRNSTTTVRADYFGKNASANISDVTTRTTIDMKGNVVSLYGTTITNTAVTSGASSYPMYLFALNTAGGIVTGAYGRFKMYSCQIYDSDTLVRDFVPCADQDGVAGLYDMVEGKFYNNAGTGTFAAGSAVEIAVEEIEAHMFPVEIRMLSASSSAKKTYAANFGDNSWTDIIEACQTGNVPDTWAVGDYKYMTIDGASYQIDIIGKNHDTYSDGGTAPLTFQMHECYSTGYAMNSSASNYGGWTSSAMRTTHLPAIMALMPAEVQTGIRAVNKKTRAGYDSTTVNTTSDLLFLISMIEAGASTSITDEGSEYEYYSTNSCYNARYRYGSTSPITWWTRTPSGSERFYVIDAEGGGAYYANNSGGLITAAFCF